MNLKISVQLQLYKNCKIFSKYLKMNYNNLHSIDKRFRDCLYLDHTVMWYATDTLLFFLLNSIVVLNINKLFCYMLG